MSINTTLKITDSRPTLNVLNNILTSVNVVQRAELESLMAENNIKFRPMFLNSELNLDAKREKLWTNGANVVSYDFITFAILFSLNGAKAIMVNVEGDEISLSLAKTDANEYIIKTLAKEIKSTMKIDVLFSNGDDEYALVA